MLHMSDMNHHAAPSAHKRPSRAIGAFFGNRRVRLVGWIVVVVTFISGLVGGYHRGRHNQPDWRDFSRESRSVWEDRAIPTGTSMFGYPPAAFFALWPFTVWSPPTLGLMAFVTVNAFAAVASCAILFRWWFVHSESAGQVVPVDKGVFVWPLFLYVAHVQHVLQANQFTLLVLFFCVAGLTLLMHDRPWLGGLSLGIGTCLKVTPAVFLVYLCLRRQWKALATMMLAIVMFNVVPSIWVFGFDGAVREHRAWLRRAGWYANHRFIENPYLRIRRHGHNCSYSIVLARWLRPPTDARYQVILHGDPPADQIERARAALKPDETLVLDPMPTPGTTWSQTRDEIPDVPRFRLAHLSGGTVRFIWMITLAIPIVWLVIATYRNRHASADSPTRAAEAALWIMLMLWPTPMLRDYYLALALPAYVVVWRRVITPAPSGRGRILAAVALGICYLSVVGMGWKTGTFYGLHLATLAILAAACAWAWRAGAWIPTTDDRRYHPKTLA